MTMAEPINRKSYHICACWHRTENQDRYHNGRNDPKNHQRFKREPDIPAHCPPRSDQADASADGSVGHDRKQANADLHSKNEKHNRGNGGPYPGERWRVGFAPGFERLDRKARHLPKQEETAMKNNFSQSQEERKYKDCADIGEQRSG
jgi:hypothetical protein